MRITIENEKIRAEIESFGAELKSLVRKSSNQEYMWEADHAFWGKTAPILFPFIGKLEGAHYRYNGKIYEADKHGFGRDMDYQVITQEQDRVVFAIESTDRTLVKFPWPFLLEVEYRLEDCSIIEQVRVHNRGKETMHFSLGGHPAFAAPLVKDGVRTGARTDCSVKMYGAEDKDVLYSTQINIADGLLTGVKLPIEVKNGVFPIVDHIFDSDALVFASEGVTAVGLLDADGKEYVRLEAATCPVWGVWSMPTSEASYVCIEPWWGICDAAGYEGTLDERPYTNYVEAGEVWQESFKMIVSA
uniref:aldose 1-epimerase family protein n=1 Tax=Acetatifactor sp. TaxID=1872090 RepID=UPI0040574939